MPGDKIGVEMRQEYVLDLEPVLCGKRHVLVDVPLRVNDDCRTRMLIANNVRSMRQTWQIELIEDHLTPPSLVDC
jgi:hypothetical protein